MTKVQQLLRDHRGIVVEDFRGLVDNGEDEATPQNGFITSQNNKFMRRGVRSREGTSLMHTIGNVRRVAIYKRIGEAQRLLILNSVGEIYDSTDLTGPILSIATMTDFSAASIFGRSYITPHDGVTGLAGEKVYVYNGTGTARPAAGTAPIGFTLTLANSGTAGTVETGDHILGVAFETNSGFVTKPGAYQIISIQVVRKSTSVRLD